MKYHVDFESFNEYRELFYEKVNSIKEIILLMIKMSEKLEWEGMAYEKAMTVYNEKIQDLSRIPQILDLFLKFMDTAINDYGEGIEELKKCFEEVLEEIRKEKLSRSEK